MERAKKFALAGALIATAATLISLPARAADRFEFVRAEWHDLGTLGGRHSAATDINEIGEIVGWSRLPDLRVHAFKFSIGTMTDLDPGSFESVANAINESSVIVGGRRSPGELAMQPVAYGAGAMRLLRLPSPPPGSCSWRGEATDINDRLYIVGIARAVGTDCDQYVDTDGLWWKGLSSVPSSVYGYPASAELRRINNAGLAVGHFLAGTLTQPMSWRPGLLRPLSLPTAPVLFEGGKTTGINDAGVIAGYSLRRGYRATGRIATQWATDTSPGEVFAIPRYDSHEWAPWDINNQNFMVGEEEGLAWIWHRDFGLVFLPYPPTRDWCHAAAMTELRSGYIYAVGDCGTSTGLGRATLWYIQIRTVTGSP